MLKKQFMNTQNHALKRTIAWNIFVGSVIVLIGYRLPNSQVDFRPDQIVRGGGFVIIAMNLHIFFLLRAIGLKNMKNEKQGAV